MNECTCEVMTIIASCCFLLTKPNNIATTMGPKRNFLRNIPFIVDYLHYVFNVFNICRKSNISTNTDFMFRLMKRWSADYYSSNNDSDIAQFVLCCMEKWILPIYQEPFSFRSTMKSCFWNENPYSCWDHDNK